ncbi:DNA/RNA non-specific endonuclease [Methylobacterium sp. C25]|uniref:DNA/RNA non-specific endonuclease n=1 Tax=Methylobacterium sp. C25 TaxID=2721622 RepID=UPI001F385AF2|nr:DNA/RNA non-specific endonuclease [Methylobacterium sp. C25]
MLADPACAAENCPGLFAGGREPVLANPRLAPNTVPLCFDAFAVLFSGVSRTPLYAAERLTRASIGAARRVDRADAFHEEDRLPGRVRSELSDYVHSGYDRGHMAPAGDMPTAEAQAQSFSLANIVPQDRRSNRGIWASIEESVRRLALRRGEIYVVTGPIFSGSSAEAVNARVLVPTQIYKAIYDPARGEAAAYLAGNDGGGDWRAVSIETLQQTAGLDPFPALPAAARAKAMSLPEPHEFSRNRSGSEESFQSWAKRELYRILYRLWRDLMRSIF